MKPRHIYQNLVNIQTTTMFAKYFAVLVAVLAVASGFETEHCKKSPLALQTMMKCGQEVLGKEVVPEDFVAIQTDEGKLGQLQNCMGREMGVNPTASLDELAKIAMAQLEIPDEDRRKKFCDSLKECLTGKPVEVKEMSICFQKTMQEICV